MGLSARRAGSPVSCILSSVSCLLYSISSVLNGGTNGATHFKPKTDNCRPSTGNRRTAGPQLQPGARWL
jgi:hypothetical protein